jgi:hypothetical protein
MQGKKEQMEEQMSLFEMGGLTDDGAMRDPVSGNEVPPGSMASEVRDDVPAMLSEGEYVIPADVVRYYGVKFFEDLRMGAKSGLNQMEQTGRIGGEPVDSTPGDEPLTPEEMQMLAEITGMYGGGMVRKGYQQGGVVSQPFTPVPNYATPGFSLFQPMQPAAPTTPVQVPQTQTVTLYGPNGEIATLTLPTDQERYNALIGQGYSTQQKIQQLSTQVSNAGVSGGEGPGDFFSPEGESTGKGLGLNASNLKSLTEDPLGFGSKSLSQEEFFSGRQLAGIGSFVAGPGGVVAGGLAGAGMQLENVARARAGLEVARAKGLSNTPEFASLQATVKSAEENLSPVARLMDKAGFGSGKNYANQVLNPSVPSPTAAPKSVSTAAPKTSEGLGSFAPTESIRPTPRPDGLGSKTAGSASTSTGGTTTTSGFGSFSVTHSDGSVSRHSSHAEAVSAANASAAKSGATVQDTTSQGGGGGGGGKVICTALHNLGLLDSEIYRLDSEYGVMLETQQPAISKGYRKLATPLANYIQKDTLGARLVRGVVAPIARAWANEMAHIMQPDTYKGNLLGKIIIKIGYPVCAFVGKNTKETTYAT